jgi:uncharacterized protein (DUF433 family)
METSISNRITTTPDICNGKQYLSAGDTAETILEAYPFLEKEDIQACIAFALKNLSTLKNEIQLAS